MPDDWRDILKQPTTTVPIAGELLGLSRNSAYEAAKRGHIKTVRLGGRLVVPTSWIRKTLEIDDQAA